MIDTLLEPQPMPAWLLDIFPKRGDRLINDSRAVAVPQKPGASIPQLAQE